LKNEECKCGASLFSTKTNPVNIHSDKFPSFHPKELAETVT